MKRNLNNYSEFIGENKDSKDFFKISEPVSTSMYPNVNRLYKNGKIVGISEILLKGGKWIKASYVNCIYDSFEENLDFLKEHADSIQLAIETEYGELRFPDYKTSEL